MRQRVVRHISVCIAMVLGLAGCGPTFPQAATLNGTWQSPDLAAPFTLDLHQRQIRAANGSVRSFRAEPYPNHMRLHFTDGEVVWVFVEHTTALRWESQTNDDTWWLKRIPAPPENNRQ